MNRRGNTLNKLRETLQKVKDLPVPETTEQRDEIIKITEAMNELASYLETIKNENKGEN